MVAMQWQIDRLEKLRELCRIEDGRGIEFGPLDKPVVQRFEGEIYYVDYTSTEVLRKNSAQDGSVIAQKIVDVDFNLEQGTLAELASAVAPFDYVIASHVFEHLPNPIGWLLELESLLAPGGVISLAIPDQRYTFDRARRLTTVGDLLAYHFEGLRRPSPVQLLDHYLNVRQVVTASAWESDPVVAEVPRYHTDEQALSLCRRGVDGEYIDCHCTVWTADHFREVIGRLGELGILKLKVARFHWPERYSNEFIVTLRHTSA